MKYDGYDALYKVRPLIDQLTTVFPKYYQPARELSLDEMMIGSRCRIAFLQYIPKKPTRFGIKVFVVGIKVFVVSETKTGYVLNFQVYTGAVSGASSRSSKKHGVAYRVVMELVENYEGKGHCLFIDNYCTSPQLLIDLLEKNIPCKAGREDLRCLREATRITRVRAIIRLMRRCWEGHACTRVYASVVCALSRGIQLYNNNYVFSVAKKRLLILSVKMQSTRELCYVRRTYINVHTLFYDVTYIYNIYSTRTLYGYN